MSSRKNGDTANQERYVYNRDIFKNNEIIDWDDWADVMGIDIASSGDGDARVAYVQTRNQIKTQINRMAQSRIANWRLCTKERGKSVIKLCDSDVVNNEIPVRCKRIGQHLAATGKEARAFSEIVGLPSKEKKLSKEIEVVVAAASLVISGHIEKMKIAPNIKQQLLDLLDLKADNDVDDSWKRVNK